MDDASVPFTKKIGRDGSPSRPYLAAQLPLSAFLLTLAPDSRFPARTSFFSIKKPDFKKYVVMWDLTLFPKRSRPHSPIRSDMRFGGHSQIQSSISEYDFFRR